VRGYFQLIKKETKIFILFVSIRTSSFAILNVAYVYVLKIPLAPPVALLFLDAFSGMRISSSTNGKLRVFLI
jgi:hypothetical protein